ncbi:MAG: YhcH/YjgK/YiaL family protein [Candidatus Riflebacteria bacterium]|nr:YhcH/YjgK/YiaL family protein [Candidatus Riflebacteria bacterium]
MNKKLQERINYALDYLKKTDLEQLELGKHVINNWLYINVQEYMTKDLSECKFESHKKYVDIQMMINGLEAIETSDIDKLELGTSYDEDKDVMFWKQKPNQMRTVISDGSYVILYPQNAHMPCVAIDKPIKVKKLVAKVLIG